MPDKTDAKKILNNLPLGELEEATRTSSYYVDETVRQDLKSNNLFLNEVVDVAQNRPLWRVMSVFGFTHSCGACHKRRSAVIVSVPKRSDYLCQATLTHLLCNSNEIL